MTQNMGQTDRILRLIVAAVLAALYFTGNISGTFASIALLLAVVFTITSFISFCPLYLPFGISTRQNSK